VKTEGLAPKVAGPAEPQIRVVLGLLLGAAFVMILNETVMGVALPHIMDSFGIEAATAQWLTTVYLLTMAVVIPATGFILDRFSTRRVFVAALTVFTLGTIVAAAAPVFGVLVVARVMQASGTAIILPLMTTTIMTFIPEERRGRTMGFVAIVISVAPAVGPAFSGLVLSFASWRFVYIAVLPFALAALALGALRVRNLAEPKHGRFDRPSFALSIVAFGGLVYGLAGMGESASSESSSVPPLVPTVLGLVATALFVRRQLRLQRTDEAFLDLRPLRQRSFVCCLVILVLAMAALFGTLILLPIYLQEVLHLSAFAAGLMLLPGGLIMGLIAPSVGRVYDRRGPRPLVLPASIILLAALALLLLAGLGTPPWFIMLAHVVLSLSLGMLFTPCITFAMGALEQDLYNHGSAILNALQQLAGAAGTALFVAVASAKEFAQLDAGAADDAALASGFHAALVCGVALVGTMIGVSIFVRGRPTSPAGDVPLH
jgi:MFS transporter, DHA2 family, lincomycin resistance protein